MRKLCCLKRNPFTLIFVLILGFTYSPVCEASLFSKFINHVAGQAKALVKAPVQTISTGIKHDEGKVEEGIKSVGQNLQEAGKDLSKGQVGKALLHTAEATITTINTGGQVLGPLGAAAEGGAVAVLTSTVTDAAKDTAIDLAIQKLPENKQEVAQKTKEGAEAARTVAELVRK